METDSLKNSIQDFAVEKWASKDKIGTVESPMKGEKTFIFLKALYTMPKDFKSIIHLFLSDTMTRESEALFEIEMFNKIFNVDVLKDYNLQFFSYLAVSEWKDREFGLVCCDKFQEQLTPEYFKFHLNNKYRAIFGVSTVLNDHEFFNIKDDYLLSAYFGSTVVTKGEMLGKIAPIVFRYNIKPGSNVSNPKPVQENKDEKLNIYVLRNKLDAKMATVKNETARTINYQTEKEAYESLTESINKWRIATPGSKEDAFEFEEKRSSEIKILLNRRNKILRNLASKKTLIEGLLFRLRGRTLIFGSYHPALEVLTPARVLSSLNSTERNALIKKTFENGRLRAISCLNDFKEVPSIEGIENCVFKDFYGSKEDFVNKISGLRKNSPKRGNVFVVVTEGTQEVTWFNEMVKDLKEHNYVLTDSLISTFNEYSKQEDN